ncbi:MAG: Na+/H+ antiporter NhaC family protein [Oscillospiraceae bacterium]
MKRERRKPSAWYSISVLLGVLAIVLCGKVFFGAGLATMFLLSWLFIFPACMRLGFSYEEIEAGVLSYIDRGMEAILIVLAVGGMIASWMAAGTVPAIICYGLELIRPKSFLLISFLLCTAVAYICGTSWGTMGTAGIAMFAVGESLGVPAACSVGAIFSGAYLGEMASPMSNSANVCASVCGVPLNRHCREAGLLLLPVMGITAVLYFFLGRSQGGGFDSSYIESTCAALSALFRIDLLDFLPVLFLLGLIAAKIPALFSMLISAVFACVLAVVRQGAAASDILAIFWSGYEVESGSDFLDALLNRGGVESMFETGAVMLFAFGMAGAFQAAGLLDPLVEALTRRTKGVLQLGIATEGMTVLGNMLGTNTFALIMTGSLMKDTYESFRLAPTDLSRTMTASSTVFCPLIPWNVSGLYIVALYGVECLDFAPYAFCAYLTPLFALLFLCFRRRSACTEEGRRSPSHASPAAAPSRRKR